MHHQGQGEIDGQRGILGKTDVIREWQTPEELLLRFKLERNLPSVQMFQCRRWRER